ncbi:transglycosylase domain-containing protein [Virgibacillus necropolis]|uniref:Penicillin-binding protein n=1 Tax=Virgibacillus necropolis TaxID=163877 RepID=A0A221MG23_9BACI|nr:PBP1A family penicillin-binding protein [Virgibacillus necropolis]ASN06570.1 penicillin-binding protein [Virgibacillus necropolis]
MDQHKKQKMIAMLNKKNIVMIIGLIAILGITGYLVIIFGGKLVVSEEDLILDATTTIETKDGEVIAELYNENRTLVAIEQIPKHVQEAFISIEDRRFYDHAGVDIQSVARAVYRDIIAFAKVEGASTITQQLAKNLFLRNDKTWMRKTKEVMAAIYLERKYTKKHILEMYLNEIYFGSGVYGVEEASQLFFSKSVKNLSLIEGAMLAGLAKAPNGYSPIDHPEKALARRNVVLQSMDHTGKISTETRIRAQGKTLGLNVQKPEETPWVDSYVDLVIKEAAENYELSVDELRRGGYRIIVSIDQTIQQIAYEQFKNDQYFPGNTTGTQGAFVMMDQVSGGIVAAIGGRSYERGNLNRATVKRLPGSTIKPIAVYGPALMKKSYTPYSLIPDQKVSIDGYTAENVLDQYEGAVSIYEALRISKNAPAVWLLDAIGVNYAKSYLEKMDISIEDNGLAIALGGLSNGITPIKMMESYRPFIHEGKHIESHTITHIYDRNNKLIADEKHKETKVFTSQVAWNMTEMLLNVVDNGTGKAGDYEKALAGKTGSTEHPLVEGEYKDAWFVGYTPQYVSALWMGYDVSDKDHFLTDGSSYPTTLTKSILTEVDKQQPLETSFEKPENVESLPEPIDLPKIKNLKASYTFGGFSLVKGKLTWSQAADERVVYHIYKQQNGIDERIGKVKGKHAFIIDNLPLFKTTSYYVVPYNPLTKVEGTRSNRVELSL